MKKVGFIVETDRGDSLAYDVYASEKLHEREFWVLGIVKGFEIAPPDSNIIRLEKEFEEVTE